MTYTRRNRVEEQQEACQKAQEITTICEQFHITLDPIDWQQFGMGAPVKVDAIEIASLVELGQRESSDILCQIQMKLFEHAALKALGVRFSLKALMWSPIELTQPQAFLSLWIITLETGERIPIAESLKYGQRVYEYYPFDVSNERQLAELFGPMNEGEYHLGETVTIKEHEHHYTGEIIYIIPPGKTTSGRKYVQRGYHTVAGRTFPNNVMSRYIVDCKDGFPHIAHQSQIIL